MTGATPDFPIWPEEDPTASQQSIEALASRCQEQADRDILFREEKKPRTSEGCDWDSDDNVAFQVSLNSWHAYEPECPSIPLYLGEEHELCLQIAYDLDVENFPVPAELRGQLADDQFELPDGIQDIRVSYNAEIQINVKHALGWQVMRFYDIEYQLAGEDAQPPQVDGDGNEYHQLQRMRVAKMLHRHTVPMFSDSEFQDIGVPLDEYQEVSDLAHADENIMAQLIDNLIDSCQSEGETAGTADTFPSTYADTCRRLVGNILDMLLTRDHRGLDLAEFFPQEVLTAIAEQ